MTDQPKKTLQLREKPAADKPAAPRAPVRPRRPARARPLSEVQAERAAREAAWAAQAGERRTYADADRGAPEDRRAGPANRGPGARAERPGPGGRAERAVTDDEVLDLSFNDLLRRAAAAGVLPDAQGWRRWRELRNLTSHAYDAELAQRVASASREFLAEARALATALADFTDPQP